MLSFDSWLDEGGRLQVFGGGHIVCVTRRVIWSCSLIAVGGPMFRSIDATYFPK